LICGGKHELTHCSAKKNTEYSSLLRLPAEIRNLIWEYTVGNLVIKVDKRRPRSSAHTLTVFGLLGVCRQTYVEAEVFVSTATACFPSYIDLVPLYGRGSLPLVRKIAMGLPLMLIHIQPGGAILPERVRHIIRSVQFIDVTIYREWSFIPTYHVPSVRSKAEKDLREQLGEKEITVRHVYSWDDWQANMDLL